MLRITKFDFLVNFFSKDSFYHLMKMDVLSSKSEQKNTSPVISFDSYGGQKIGSLAITSK